MKRASKDTGDSTNGFDYLTSHHRCAWETAGKRCFLPAGFSTGVIGKDKGYCTYHTGYLDADSNLLKHVDDPEVFDEWVDVHRQAYNHVYASCWICGYTKASLWAAVLGDYDSLKQEAEELVFPDDLPGEAVEGYKKLTQEINAGKHSPESWRAALGALNEKWGVKMPIPPIPTELVGVGRRRVHVDKTAAVQVAEAEEAKLL